MLRLGIVPHGQEVLRLIAWVAATFLYVALWLAFGLLLSVVIRRAATAALVGFGVWLLVSIFGGLITTILTGLIAPAAGATADNILRHRAAPGVRRHACCRARSTRRSPGHPRPERDARDVTIPSTIGQYTQAQQQIPALLSLDQSLLLVWPQIVALVALTVVCFAGAYVAFMRQEVRA